MLEKITSFENACRLVDGCHLNHQRVVFVHGVFDLLHSGHVHLLTEAKKLADVLIVGVECDANVKNMKGHERPINDLTARCFVLSSLQCVDYMFEIQEKDRQDFYRNLYRLLGPDFIGGHLMPGGFAKQQQRDAILLGIDYVFIEHGYEVTTTQLAKQLKKSVKAA